MLTPTSAAVLAILTGAALELGVHAVSGRREAWDSEIFWTAGLPLAMLVAFGIGWFSRGRAWTRDAGRRAGASADDDAAQRRVRLALAADADPLSGAERAIRGGGVRGAPPEESEAS